MQIAFESHAVAGEMSAKQTEGVFYSFKLKMGPTDETLAATCPTAGGRVNGQPGTSM